MSAELKLGSKVVGKERDCGGRHARAMRGASARPSLSRCPSDETRLLGLPPRAEHDLLRSRATSMLRDAGLLVRACVPPAAASPSPELHQQLGGSTASATALRVSSSTNTAVPGWMPQLAATLERVASELPTAASLARDCAGTEEPEGAAAHLGDPLAQCVQREVAATGPVLRR